MTNVVVRVAAWLMDLSRGEQGQSLGSFGMILMFAVVAAGLALAMASSGMLDPSGNGGAPGVEAPQFDPPNPFD